MSYADSDLNNPFRCDFSFAVTQGAVNATLMEYLSTLPFPDVTCVWVMNTNNPPEPEQIPFKTLLERANNSDPFKVPDNADPTTNKDIQNLVGARFLGGFRAQIGLPGGLSDSTNVVTFGADTTSVEFNLLCSSFNVVQYTPAGQYTPASWMHKSQPDGNPWIFTSRVNLLLAKFDGNVSSLPPAVQQRIASLNLQPDAFSIQRLFFDLDCAKLETVPTLSGVPKPSPLYDWLQEYFMGAYWATMKANNQPILMHGIVTQPDDSSLPLTHLRFQTSEYIVNGVPPKNVGDLNTLSYLGATGSDVLPVNPVPCTWNWIDAGERSNWHGAVAVNKQSFRAWLRRALLPYVTTQCIQFNPHCEAKGSEIYLWCRPQSGMSPTTSTPTKDSQLAYFTYTKKEDSGARSSQITAEENFSMEVTQSGDSQITIVQNVKAHLYVYVFGSWTQGNVVNSTISSVYDMSVDAAGSVHLTLNEKASTRTDSPDSLDWGKFADWVLDYPNEKVIDPVVAAIRSLIDTMQNPDLRTVRFIVPGHTDVVYSGARFSTHGDVVFHLIYNTPSK